MSIKVTVINVRSKQDILDKYKEGMVGKIVFAVKSKTPEITEIKIRDHIRQLGLFKNSDDYDVLIGDPRSIEKQLSFKGYEKLKPYSATYRRMCPKCISLSYEKTKKISFELFRELTANKAANDTNVLIMLDDQKCIIC